ncbi:Peptidyl-tRNA hydrolase [Wickerhamomyces ciferrii]|uniref:Peptidyl-tRNA hydrolase n=1 Tax=Wickerhamomyces ciferrii (strain ATCC 14091 / BCRC 22168 / CBS 111 / JCM 3599 / NBRC 0793 / NRRL Y-1031 F-60-10) TaxID=1206466 RepID=K0KEF8_WICCF|nr:Peptidyl-tRNA hydrolase [Wickerhamomyces ciferrii]CCH40627.1 Peptidyl-tRNA hydrolase [Wickerhamomyces ciferrii]
MVFATRCLWKAANVQGLKQNVGAGVTKKPIFLMVTSVGNPELSYGGTRHNAGHLVLNMTRIPFVDHPRVKGIRFGMDLNKSNMIYIQNNNFMNISGGPISKAWDYFTDIKSKTKDWDFKYLVVHDELSLELGKYKIRSGDASLRGHNGLKSIKGSTNKDFLRLGVGIGRPESRNPHDVAEYVLSPFTRKEKIKLEEQVVPEVLMTIERIRNGEEV